MTMDINTLISLLAILFSLVTAIFSILSFCKVVGLENSTHKIQYLPLQEYNDFNKEMSENIEEGKKVDLEKIEKERQKKMLKQFEAAYTTGE